ncbi:MAG: hypothetical protein EZS28_026846 [Streblomastix strix]|uniref:Uncharacterized protein n=1 Tax=Streblomastix strix TaxID=222440 RepID=A0A5J4V4G7_9EUKA|nr:MAG: hypothetical protein EZS28_026846 [Streblomastix strix]
MAVPVKDPVLYFLYFIGMQLPWIVVPVISIFYSIFRVTKLAGGSKSKDNNKPKKIKNDADKKKISTPKDKKNK